MDEFGRSNQSFGYNHPLQSKSYQVRHNMKWQALRSQRLVLVKQVINQKLGQGKPQYHYSKEG